eukprot:TRINITY_DN109595_c0_g1_i1.p1 TRINITY_DN109595_c0_g1~~TRINITY_DN109595_c0_g1_i1.p1  ORF type:complete len:394 (+),score=62.09 TRINITY_DN109595_c0_g1_i1:102-1184(+)
MLVCDMQKLSANELLRQQLRAQADILKAQTENFELQKALLQFLETASISFPPEEADPNNDLQPARPAQPQPDDPVDPVGKEDFREEPTPQAPWSAGPPKSSWCRAGLAEWAKHPVDMSLPYDLLPHFMDIGLASLEPAAFKSFVLSMLEQVVLFLVLVLSVLLPAQLESEIPNNTLQAVKNMLIAIGNIICLIAILQSMLLYKVGNVVSDVNFVTWMSANKTALVITNILSGGLGWILSVIVVLAYIDKAIQAKPEVLGMSHTAVIISTPACVALFFPVLIQANIAARSAVYSGALSNRAIPVEVRASQSSIADGIRTFWGAALGGQKLGFKSMMRYYIAARDASSKAGIERTLRKSSSL